MLLLVAFEVKKEGLRIFSPDPVSALDSGDACPTSYPFHSFLFDVPMAPFDSRQSPLLNHKNVPNAALIFVAFKKKTYGDTMRPVMPPLDSHVQPRQTDLSTVPFLCV